MSLCFRSLYTCATLIIAFTSAGECRQVGETGVREWVDGPGAGGKGLAAFRDTQFGKNPQELLLRENFILTRKELCLHSIKMFSQVFLFCKMHNNFGNIFT